MATKHMKARPKMDGKADDFESTLEQRFLELMELIHEEFELLHEQLDIRDKLEKLEKKVQELEALLSVRQVRH